nr:immunoglobulin heavy chain junction region [Macaca mulatta]
CASLGGIVVFPARLRFDVW